MIYLKNTLNECHCEPHFGEAIPTNEQEIASTEEHRLAMTNEMGKYATQRISKTNPRCSARLLP
jgi:hypothetical protein